MRILRLLYHGDRHTRSIGSSHEERRLKIQMMYVKVCRWAGGTEYGLMMLVWRDAGFGGALSQFPFRRLCCSLSASSKGEGRKMNIALLSPDDLLEKRTFPFCRTGPYAKSGDRIRASNRCPHRSGNNFEFAVGSCVEMDT